MGRHPRSGASVPPRRVRREVHLPDQLPATCPVLAADARIAPSLGLALADRRRAHPRAAFDDVLVDLRALARDEPLAGIPDTKTSFGQIGAVLAHRHGDADEQVTFLGQADGPWILAAVALPVAGRRRLGREREGLAGDERRRSGDRRRLLTGPSRSGG